MSTVKMILEYDVLMSPASVPERQSSLQKKPQTTIKRIPRHLSAAFRPSRADVTVL